MGIPWQNKFLQQLSSSSSWVHQNDVQPRVWTRWSIRTRHSLSQKKYVNTHPQKRVLNRCDWGYWTQSNLGCPRCYLRLLLTKHGSWHLSWRLVDWVRRQWRLEMPKLWSWDEQDQHRTPSYWAPQQTYGDILTSRFEVQGLQDGWQFAHVIAVFMHWHIRADNWQLTTREVEEPKLAKPNDRHSFVC